MNRRDPSGMMRQTPTGNNLLEGQMVVTFTGTDAPADIMLTAAEGSLALQDDSGTLRLWGYTRDVGWQVL